MTVPVITQVIAGVCEENWFAETMIPNKDLWSETDHILVQQRIEQQFTDLPLIFP